MRGTKGDIISRIVLIVLDYISIMNYFLVTGSVKVTQVKIEIVNIREGVVTLTVNFFRVHIKVIN